MSVRFGTFATIIGSIFAHSLCAAPQNYTISAKPGVVNYIEGTVYLNGAKLSEAANRNTVMAAGDVLSTDTGKAEVLLAPGIFLRIGEQSDIRMVAPSLVQTQVAVVRGEAILEAAGLIKGSTVQVTDHGATITIEKNGLYRFKADEPPSAAVLEGKASVYFGQEKVQLGKNHETVLSAGLKSEKFNPKQEDELYAWSNVRSEYEAAASYQAAKTAASAGTSGFAYGYAGGLYNPGWFWNTAFNSWCWLPATGAFYSPFGWGFYSPAVVGYAPVVTTGVYRGGHWDHNGNGSGNGNNPNHHHWNGTSTAAAVPVRTDHPPAVGVVAASPWATQQARAQAARSLAATGAFNPAAGSRSFGPSAHVAAPAPAAVHGGGWAGGAGHATGAAPAGAGGPHAGGGGWAGAHGSGGGWARGAAHAGGGAPAGGGGGHAGGGGGGGGHH
jgi:hypothetical protein